MILDSWALLGELAGMMDAVCIARFCGAI